MGQAYPIAIALKAARHAPLNAGETAAQLVAHGSMRLLYYAPRASDPQKPHTQDELYVVTEGNGTFFCDGRRERFAAGDVLFAPAGAEHRFEDFSENFGTWVVFYGPKGGER